MIEKAAKFFEAALQGPEGEQGARLSARTRPFAGNPEALPHRLRAGVAQCAEGASGRRGIPQEQMIEAGLLDRGRGHPRLLRPLPRPDHLPDHRFSRPGDRLRRARAVARRAGEVPELAGDAALPQEPRPLQRPGGASRLRGNGRGHRGRGLYRRDRLRRRRLRGDRRAARHGADRRSAPHALADGRRADPLLRRRRGGPEGGISRRAPGARRI